MRDQVVIVTGASAGVGRATVRELGKRGAKVGLIARGIEGLRGAQADVEHLGGHAAIAQADVSDAEQLERAASHIEEILGPVDVWINNAMVTILAPLQETSADEFARVTQVTYLGAVHGTMTALRRMRSRDHGHIIQVGSALAYRSIPLQAAYCGAKAGIRGFTDSLRSELLHDKSRIRITMVQLPGLNTPQFTWCRTRLPKHPQPVPPIFAPEVAARAIVSAIGQDRREMYVAGSTVQAVVGTKVIPGLLDHYLAHKAYGGQQSEASLDPRRPDNLFDPVSGDRGAHGVFGDEEKPVSVQAWLSRHRHGLAAGAGALLVGLAAWANARSRSTPRDPRAARRDDLARTRRLNGGGPRRAPREASRFRGWT